jgi:hypothetical protein
MDQPTLTDEDVTTEYGRTATVSVTADTDTTDESDTDTTDASDSDTTDSDTDDTDQDADADDPSV